MQVKKQNATEVAFVSTVVGYLSAAQIVCIRYTNGHLFEFIKNRPCEMKKLAIVVGCIATVLSLSGCPWWMGPPPDGGPHHHGGGPGPGYHDHR